MDDVTTRMRKAHERLNTLMLSANRTQRVFSEEDTFTALTGVLMMDTNQEEMFEIAAAAIMRLEQEFC